MIHNFDHSFHDNHHNYIGRAGDRLRAKHLWGDHIGTLNWDGRVWAASKKFNGIRLVCLRDFLGGAPLENEGHIGHLSRQQVLASYAALESEGYCVWTKNCEHIDNYVRGLGYTSPQIKTALLVSVTTVLLIAANRR